MKQKAMTGVKVIELGQLIAGPFAGKFFAEFGAEVIKIEPPAARGPDGPKGGGDPLRTWRKLHNGTSLWWHVQSRNKKSLTVDLRRPEGQRIVRELCRDADVVIENFRPGTLEKWNIGWEHLSALNPRLVMLRLSGFGQTGPMRDLAGFGSVAEAMGGMRYVTGFPDRPPVRINLSIGDALAAMHGVIGALMALRHRDQVSGRGQVVDVALYEAVFNMMESTLPEFDATGEIRERTGSNLTGIVPSNTYQSKDGKHVVIGANGDSIFKRLMSLMGRDDLGNDPALADNAGRARARPGARRCDSGVDPVARRRRIGGAAQRGASAERKDLFDCRYRRRSAIHCPRHDTHGDARRWPVAQGAGHRAQALRDAGRHRDARARAGPAHRPGVARSWATTPRGSPRSGMRGRSDCIARAASPGSARPRMTRQWCSRSLRNEMRLMRTLAALIVGLVIGAVACDGGGGPSPPGVRDEIELAAAQAQRANLGAFYIQDDRLWLERFYDPVAYAPVWSSAGKAHPAVAEAIAQLQAAPARGLTPADYDVEWLAGEGRRLMAGEHPDRELAHFDVSLTLALLHYLADMHLGRLRSAYTDVPFEVRMLGFDPVEQLRTALAPGRLAQIIAAAEPGFPIYRRLKTALAQYRQLAAQPLSPLPALPAGVRKIEPGASYAGAAALRERLVVSGDLPAATPAAPDDRYEQPLVEGVKLFQDRHGLEPDGVLGKQTLAELNIPLATRANQIELSMERLRWLPYFPDGPLIAVNIPSFKLWAFDAGPSSLEPALAMRVIVGRSMRTQTPAFIGEMRYIEFNPYWNVPPSITRQEILPKLQRDPGYLERNDMEFVGTGKSAAVSTTVDAAALAALRAGKLRVRQRPGATNALGTIKFGLPNSENIYLHATPAKALFRALPARFQPRLHSPGKPGRAGAVCAARPAGMERRTHRGRDGPGQDAHGAASRADSGRDLLYDCRCRSRRARVVHRRRLSPR